MGKVRAEESIGLIILSSLLGVRIEIPCICYTKPNSPNLPSLTRYINICLVYARSSSNECTRNLIGGGNRSTQHMLTVTLAEL